jgi:pimeloyl-ACP methyl ester carboxylesterase
MATAITMPRLGLSMVEGTVVEWRIGPGGAVAKGQVILVVSSEKAEVEVEAFAAGVLAAIYEEVGATVPVGALLGAVAEPGEAFDAAAFRAAFVPDVPGAPAPRPGRAGVGPGGGAPPGVRETPARGAPLGPGTHEMPAGGAPGASPEPGPHVKAAPAARALARRLGVDLGAVAGTGPGGRVAVEDVERAATAMRAPAAAPAGVGTPSATGAGLAYTATGAGTPLLLIAGWGADASGWRPQVDDLARAATVVAYDHRGIGGSHPLGEEPLTIARLAEDAHALLAHVGGEPAVAVGASLGAAVAIELALAHPGRLRALALIAPVVEPDARFAAVLRGLAAHDDPRAEARIRSMLPWLLGRATLADAGRREAFAAALRAMAARTPAATLRRQAEALLAWLGTRTADLGRLELPALVVAGDDDALTPPPWAERVSRSLARARLEIVPGAGHAVAAERAERVNPLVRALLAS